MSTMEFYLERAAQCRRDADAAGLANVRDRHLIAADAWEGMAARLRKTQSHREANQAARDAVAAE